MSEKTEARGLYYDSRPGTADSHENRDIASETASGKVRGPASETGPPTGGETCVGI